MEEESAPLPDELITEILVRLPVKSLLRFKIVSKSWYALIRSPNFVNQHTKHDRKGTMLLLNRRMKDDIILSLHDPDSSDFCRLSPKFPVPFRDSTFTDRLEIVGPCNGLFFLSTKSKPMLCNPALREIKVLPPRPSYLCQHDDEVYYVGNGFGFDSLTGSYKVISIYEVLGGFPEVELYDSRSNCWRMIDSTYEMLPYVCGSFGIFFKGACHWETRYDYSSEPVVLSFNVSTEVFRHFEFPKWDGDYEKGYRLFILRDRLTLVCSPRFSLLRSSISVDFWVMEEYGVKESWAQTFKIELNCPVRKVLSFWEWILVEDDNGRPKCLDLRNSELGRAFRLCGQCYFWNAIIFKESLISLDDVICSAQDGGDFSSDIS